MKCKATSIGKINLAKGREPNRSGTQAQRPPPERRIGGLGAHDKGIYSDHKRHRSQQSDVAVNGAGRVSGHNYSVTAKPSSQEATIPLYRSLLRPHLKNWAAFRIQTNERPAQQRARTKTRGRETKSYEEQRKSWFSLGSRRPGVEGGA